MACYYMSTEPLLCFVLYGVSCLLDAADGYVARALNQCSKFGAVLDMVTDRSTTTCLLTYLAMVFPGYALLFQFLISLDLSSHYMHMYSSLVGGATSHKQIGKSANPILRLYYHNRTVLFLVCAGNELFFVLLYMLYHSSPDRARFSFLYDDTMAHMPTVHLVCTYLLWIVAPVCLLKQGINVVQLVNASTSLVRLDTDERRQATTGGVNGAVSSGKKSGGAKKQQ
ncbi:phosphatidylinositol synthase 1 (CDP-alcohol phosphatidyltransferase1) [Sorochytrium milnesiophthora]